MSILEAPRRRARTRFLARLSLAPFALLLGATPAAAQDAGETMPLEPLAIFKTVCLGGGARLNRKTANEAGVATLPDPARRALGKLVPKTQAEAAVAGPADPAAVPNRMYQIAGGPLYLLVPSAVATSAAPLADSCMVLWQSAGEDDYLAARKVVLPNEDSVPMYLRPNSKPNGFVFATSVTGQSRLTLATYGGWIALRSSTETPPADPK
ncbi:hypothetical protein IAG41_17385 [Sphingomonas sp. JC676]|uniref:hypothetical protein n=1 Tax=Sphingomonas sp. JC676 TaxID=2768065 RepID=UPI001657EFB4|nr:hypothetical protein [Sphingomonas sp. JC676]MBC9034165.1 hypothetical protein [Sphingomonas sp. JC676]